MKLRIITALIFGTLFLVLSYFGQFYFLGWIVVLTFLASREFFLICQRVGGKVNPSAGAFASALVPLVFYLKLESRFYLFLSGILIIFYLIKLVGQDIENIVKDTGYFLSGILYPGLLSAHIIMLRRLECGFELICFLLAVIWAFDSFSYLVGVKLGRKRLAKKISPLKSVEGLAGGIVCSLVIVLLLKYLFDNYLTNLNLALNYVQCLAAGIVIMLFAQSGDLVESMIKRSVNIKDSAGIFPGHGGALDRLDSLLLAAPAFYYFVKLVKYVTLSKIIC